MRNFPMPLLAMGGSSRWQPRVSAVRVAGFPIRIYSQKPGRKEALRIMDRIYGLLHYGTLSLVESSVIELRVERAETALMGDQKTIEGELIMACLMAEEA